MPFVSSAPIGQSGGSLDQSDITVQRPDSLLIPPTSRSRPSSAQDSPPRRRRPQQQQPQQQPSSCDSRLVVRGPLVSPSSSSSQSNLPSQRPRCVSLTRPATSRSAQPEQKRRRSFIEAITQGEEAAAAAAREGSPLRAPPPTYQPPPPAAARHAPSKSELAPHSCSQPPAQSRASWHRRYASAELDSRSKAPGEAGTRRSQDSGGSAPSSLRQAAPAVRSALEAFAARSRAPRQRHSVAVTGQSSGTPRAFSVIVNGSSAAHVNLSATSSQPGPRLPDTTAAETDPAPRRNPSPHRPAHLLLFPTSQVASPPPGSVRSLPSASRPAPCGSSTPAPVPAPLEAEATMSVERNRRSGSGSASLSQPDLPSLTPSPICIPPPRPHRTLRRLFEDDAAPEQGRGERRDSNSSLRDLLALIDSPSPSPPFGSPASSTDFSSPATSASSPASSSSSAGTSCSASPLSSDLSSLQLSHAHSNVDVSASSPGHTPSSPGHTPSSPGHTLSSPDHAPSSAGHTPPPHRRLSYPLAWSTGELAMAGPGSLGEEGVDEEVRRLGTSASDAALDHVMVNVLPSDLSMRERLALRARSARSFVLMSDTDSSGEEDDLAPRFVGQPRLDMLGTLGFPSLPPPPPHVVESNAPRGDVPPGTENDWLIAYYLQQEENQRGGPPHPPPLPPERPRADTPTPSLPEGGAGVAGGALGGLPSADQEEMLHNLLRDMQGIMSMFQNVDGGHAFPHDVPHYKVPPLSTRDLRRLDSHKYGAEKGEKPEGKGEREECSICYSPFLKSERVRSLPCKHVYHMKCIDLWFKESGTCPFCRLDVRKALRKSHRRRQKTRATSSTRGANGSGSSGGIEVGRASVGSQTVRSPARGNHCTIL